MTLNALAPPTLLLAIVFAPAPHLPGAPADAAEAAARVLIRDSSFEVHPIAWTPTQGIQVIDLGFHSGGVFSGVGYARTQVECTESGRISFGVAGAGLLRIWINGTLVHTHDWTKSSRPVEYAYDRFHWPTRFEVDLPKGRHEVVAEITGTEGAGRLFLQACDEHGAMDSRVNFPATDTEGWWIARPASGPANSTSHADLPKWMTQGTSSPVFGHGGALEHWQLAAKPLIEDYVVRPDAVFNQHSLVEWHYANGVTHLAILEAADGPASTDLRDHVGRFVSSTLGRLPADRNQFESLHAWRGANYRLFRACLLDDTSAPALPFMELVRRGESPEGEMLVESIVDFVLKRHPRLADGTLCRDEPEPRTVWADDLFMSAAFLARAADWRKDPEMWDEIVRQTRLFHEHLINPQTGLYWHGHYASRRMWAHFHWGRANGWMAWAMAEVLRFLPEDHPGFQEVSDLHRRHLEALLPRQAEGGLWRQLLDHPETYEETSASAMFLIAMARGMEERRLDPARFGEPARRAWAGLQTRIDERGVVRGICRGTGIGGSVEYYAGRPTRDHDPRGLGAFISAAVAMDSWLRSPAY